MREIVFRVTQESDGGYCAECLTESIFAEGDTWDELAVDQMWMNVIVIHVDTRSLTANTVL